MKPLNGMGLLFGDDNGEVVPVQQPTAEPPIGVLPSAPAAPKKPGGKLDGMELLMGPQPQPTKKSDPAQGGWVGSRLADMVRGKQDPNYANTPDFRDVDMGGVTGAKRLLSAVTGADDAQLGDIYQKGLGDRFKRRFKDANGAELIEYVDSDGQTKTGYINKPGLDMQDVARGVFGAVPYVAGGLGLSGLMKGMHWGARGAAQAAAAGATSLTGDAGTSAMGGRFDALDSAKKAGFTAAMGAAGEVLPVRTLATLGGAGVGAAAQFHPESTMGELMMGTGIGGVAGGAAGYAAAAAARKLGMRVGPYLDRSTGKLTAEGEALAKSQGIDPATMTGPEIAEFAKVYAMTKDAAAAATKSDMLDFNIPVTVGQRSKDPQQLLREKNMRYGIHGDGAKVEMREFDRKQYDAILSGVFGDGPTPGIGQQVNPESWKNIGIAGRGESAREGVNAVKRFGDAAEDAAWSKVGPIKPDETARALLPQEIKRTLESTPNLPPITENTPVAAQMVQALQAYQNGTRPGMNSAFLPDQSGQGLNEFRKLIGGMVGDAATPSDRAAAGAVYRAFNDWADTVAARGLVDNPAGVPAMKAARAVSADWKGLFQPRDGGKPSAAVAKLEEVMRSSNAPERVINEIIGDTTVRAMPGAGRLEAVKQLKLILDRGKASGDDALAAQSAQAWNDIRSAYWERMVVSKQNEMKSPQELLNALRQARTNQHSIMMELFTAQERNQMRKLEAALKHVAYKDPNPSGTASAAGSMVRQLTDTIASAFAKSRLAQTAVAVPVAKWLIDANGKAMASRATNQAIKPRLPSYGPYGAAAGATTERYD